MHAPNTDAVVWFIREIFPFIRETNPGIVFNVVGSSPPDEVTNMVAEGINIMGEVSDDALCQIYREVRVVVAPLRFGAGVKGKILESMARGVPVVTTSVGAEGIPDANNALLVADEPQFFAEQVIEVYSKPELWNHAFEQGYQVLNRYYTKEVTKEIFAQDMPVK